MEKSGGGSELLQRQLTDMRDKVADMEQTNAEKQQVFYMIQCTYHNYSLFLCALIILQCMESTSWKHVTLSKCF